MHDTGWRVKGSVKAALGATLRAEDHITKEPIEYAVYCLDK